MDNTTNEIPKYEIIKFLSSKSIGDISYSNIKEKDFSGTVIFYDMQGTPLRTEVYKNGKTPDKHTNTKINSGYKYAPKDPCLDGCYVLMITQHWTDYYDQNGGYIGSGNEYTTSEYVWVGGSNPDNTSYYDNNGDVYHNHLDYSHGPAIGSDNHAVEVLIDSSIEGYPCLEEVINAILASNSALFKETIGRFIDNPKYDLKFTIGECGITDIACTDDTNLEETGEILIKFEDPNQNPIDLASTILHEGIHAEIYRFVKEHHDGNIDPNDKPQLFEYYQHYKLAVDEEHIDHPYMTQYYITPIAEALRELDNDQYSLDYYKTFAWDGLRDFDPNNSLGSIDEDYGQYRNEVTLNFNITCDE
ncbi:MAG TPA: hypothetical protein VIM94_12390 [Salegentibacter sp.]|uniref:hypothetical protein n=1 Tax=Salegentibacter sp. TaxID=1903072 RepID=UPI002F9202F4